MIALSSSMLRFIILKLVDLGAIHCRNVETGELAKITGIVHSSDCGVSVRFSFLSGIPILISVVFGNGGLTAAIIEKGGWDVTIIHTSDTFYLEVLP